MSKEDGIIAQGIIEETLPNMMFRVRITSEGFADKDGKPFLVLTRVSGKMQKFNIRMLPGDIVTVELSPYDLTRGRIIYRGVRDKDRPVVVAPPEPESEITPESEASPPISPSV